jgi:hypothetical protein
LQANGGTAYLPALDEAFRLLGTATDIPGQTRGNTVIISYIQSFSFFLIQPMYYTSHLLEKDGQGEVTQLSFLTYMFFFFSYSTDVYTSQQLEKDGEGEVTKLSFPDFVPLPTHIYMYFT